MNRDLRRRNDPTRSYRDCSFFRFGIRPKSTSLGRRSTSPGWRAGGKASTVKVNVLCGSNTIGGNKILLSFDGKNVLFDFGLDFKTKGEYCDSFLGPRPSRGIHDYIALGLLPGLDVYRDDQITADFRDRSRLQHQHHRHGEPLRRRHVGDDRRPGAQGSRGRPRSGPSAIG